MLFRSSIKEVNGNALACFRQVNDSDVLILVFFDIFLTSPLPFRTMDTVLGDRLAAAATSLYAGGPVPVFPGGDRPLYQQFAGGVK